MEGKIVKNISNDYDVLIDNEIITCQPRGKFRNLNLTPLVGDIVDIDYQNHYILEIYNRKNELKRPRVANVDVALIVTSVTEPKLSTNLLDKTICLIHLSKIEPVIVFTKLDLLNNLDEINSFRKYYEKIGYKVFYNTEVNDMIEYLKHKTVVLTGQSGAGKSSLINRLGDLSIKTSEISHALGRGKHTTRNIEIYHINDIDFLDTPGFSALDLEEYSKEDIKNSFIEFNSDECKYKDCMHDKETICGVKSRVISGNILTSRYESYLSFIMGEK